jgi:hypothetical protein
MRVVAGRLAYTCIQRARSESSRKVRGARGRVVGGGDPDMVAREHAVRYVGDDGSLVLHHPRPSADEPPPARCHAQCKGPTS